MYKLAAGTRKTFIVPPQIGRITAALLLQIRILRHFLRHFAAFKKFPKWRNVVAKLRSKYPKYSTDQIWPHNKFWATKCRIFH